MPRRVGAADHREVVPHRRACELALEERPHDVDEVRRIFAPREQPDARGSLQSAYTTPGIFRASSA